MKRVALARSAPLVGKTQLRRTTGMPRQPLQRPQEPSNTGSVGNDWPPEVREALAARSRGWCEICHQQPATDAHHRKRRREADHTVSNGLHLCRTCHAGAHAHPAEARGHGWIVPTWADPATTPVLINGNRWCLLTAGGGYRTDQRGWPT